MKMICITDIKLVEVDREEMSFHRLPQMFPVIGSDPVEFDTVTVEHIKGKIFRTRDGRELCFGMSKEVQDAIGIPLDAFEGMQRTMDIVESNNYNLKLQLSKLERMTFWQAVKHAISKTWLFDQPFN